MVDVDIKEFKMTQLWSYSLELTKSRSKNSVKKTVVVRGNLISLNLPFWAEPLPSFN